MKQQKIHINDNEIDILSHLCTWLIDFHNYDVSKISEGRTQVLIPLEQYNSLKVLVGKVNQVISGIDKQIAVKTAETNEFPNEILCSSEK